MHIGPFAFSVNSNIQPVQDYVESHYDQYIASNQPCFIDYNVSVEHGPLIRRLHKPQSIFKFNYRTPFKPLPLNQGSAFLEWGMNWVIANEANQFFSIHAATLEKDGKGVIISAPSGSGKSTLCAYLVSQGWRLLSDELALLCPKTMMLYGLGRPINLKNHSIDLMKNYYPSKSFSEVIADTTKGTISLLKPPTQSIKSIQQPVKPNLLVFVCYNEDEQCYMEPIEKSLALTEVIKNSFNFSLLNKNGFIAARNLVSQTNAVYIEYNNFQSCETALLDALK